MHLLLAKGFNQLKGLQAFSLGQRHAMLLSNDLMQKSQIVHQIGWILLTEKCLYVSVDVYFLTKIANMVNNYLHFAQKLTVEFMPFRRLVLMYTHLSLLPDDLHI